MLITLPKVSVKTFREETDRKSGLVLTFSSYVKLKELKAWRAAGSWRFRRSTASLVACLRIIAPIAYLGR